MAIKLKVIKHKKTIDESTLFEAQPANQATQQQTEQPAATQQPANQQTTQQPANQQTTTTQQPANQQATQQPSDTSTNQQTQQENNGTQLNAQEINNNVLTFIANLGNTIKNACAADKMVEAIPGIKVAKEMQNCPVKQEFDDLNKAVSDLANINIKADDPDSITNGFTAFNTIIDKLSAFNTAVNEKAKENVANNNNQA